MKHVNIGKNKITNLDHAISEQNPTEKAGHSPASLIWRFIFFGGG